MVLKKASIILLSVFSCLAFAGWQMEIPPVHLKKMQKKVIRHYKPTPAQLITEHNQWISSKSGSGYCIPIKSAAENDLGYLHYRKAAACSFGGCVDTACATGSVGFKEYIFYYMIANNQGEIERLGILEYESSYGYEISSQSWLKQFYGSKAGEFKLNENIDGISGATVSVKAMIQDLNSLKHQE